MEGPQLLSVIESILFTSDKPVSVERFIEVLGEETISPNEIKGAITDIQSRYLNAEFGFELREAQGGYQFTTKVANSEWVRKFLQTKPFRLGRSALETLAIIAYRQPVTRAEIDKVRGIDSSHLMRTLIERGLVKMAGKAEVPGRPVQYGTTQRFLEVTGLKSLGELPPLSELEQLQGTVEHKDPLEDGMESFMKEAPTSRDIEAGQLLDEGLIEIDQLIQSTARPDREIYSSEAHAEVARENEAALEGFLAFMKPYRKPRKAAVVSEDTTPPPTELMN